MKYLQELALLACALITAPVASQLVALTEFHERLETSVPVSGSTLVGLLRGDTSGALTIDNLAVDLPAGVSGTLCIDMATRDGRYIAWQNFAVSASPGGTADLSIRSKRQQRGELRVYSARDLAIRAQLRTRCDGGAPGTYVAARWANRPRVDRLTILINVKLSSARVALLNGAGRSITGDLVACTPVDAGSRTAYDHQCAVTLPPGQSGAVRSLKLEITGTTGSRRSENYPLGLI